jgi:hypothetical protein
MAEFDGHGSQVASTAGGLAIAVLNFPLLYVGVPAGLGTVGQYALLVLNSMLWGAAGVALWSRLNGWRRRAANVGG